MKWDIAIFEPIYNAFEKDLIKIEAWNYSNEPILDEASSVYIANRRVLIDEIDHAFFTNNLNIDKLKKVKASGVTATAHKKEGADHEW